MSDGVRTALVTGGNRGIGFEACRQLARSGLRVVLTARDPDLGTAAARHLQEEGLDVQFTSMDVGDERSVADCARELGEARIQVDVLVNNAGTYPEGALLALDTEKLVDAFRINFLGAAISSVAETRSRAARPSMNGLKSLGRRSHAVPNAARQPAHPL